jgi:hypothetical protein
VVNAPPVAVNASITAAYWSGVNDRFARDVL